VTKPFPKEILLPLSTGNPTHVVISRKGYNEKTAEFCFRKGKKEEKTIY
jgi:hypothetical protein